MRMQGYVSWLRAIILLVIGLYAQDLAAQRLKITDFACVWLPGHKQRLFQFPRQQPV